MKKKLVVLALLASALIMMSVKASADETNGIDASKMTLTFYDPFPAEFDGLVKTNPFPGVYPVAIYKFRLRDSKVHYVCGGLWFNSDNRVGYRLITNEHLFLKGDEDYAYAIRRAIPGNTNIDGFVDQILSTGKDNNGLDIAFTSIGPRPRAVKGFYTGAPDITVFITLTNAVTLKTKSVSSVRSLTTLNESKILGSISYHPGSNTVDAIITDFKADDGHIGMPFFDEFGRLYIVGGVVTIDKKGKVAYVFGPFGFY